MEEDTYDVLIVDDTPENLELLIDLLSQEGYKVRALPDGEMALVSALTSPPDLILLDIAMPEMDGYEVCSRLKQHPELKAIPVIFMSALSSTFDKVKAFKAGGVDYITKPFEFDEVQARVRTHLQNHRMRAKLAQQNEHLNSQIIQQTDELSQAQFATILAMTKMAEARDDDTGAHIDRIREYCKIIATDLKRNSIFPTIIDEEFINNIYYASPLHDIGKVAIPDRILLKPGRLSPEEYEIMKEHAVIGSQNLQIVGKQWPNNRFLKMGITISRSHHERWDGKGYPDGLAGNDIPLAARIMALADVYDALRSERVYKEAFSHEKSADLIIQASGSQFDPRIIDSFKRVEELFIETRKHLTDAA